MPPKKRKCLQLSTRRRSKRNASKQSPAKPKLSPESKTKDRHKRCVYLGNQFQRWRDIQEKVGSKCDTELAGLLMDTFEQSDAANQYDVSTMSDTENESAAGTKSLDQDDDFPDAGASSGSDSDYLPDSDVKHMKKQERVTRSRGKNSRTSTAQTSSTCTSHENNVNGTNTSSIVSQPQPVVPITSSQRGPWISTAQGTQPLISAVPNLSWSTGIMAPNIPLFPLPLTPYSIQQSPFISAQQNQQVFLNQGFNTTLIGSNGIPLLLNPNMIRGQVLPQVINSDGKQGSTKVNPVIIKEENTEPTSSGPHPVDTEKNDINCKKDGPAKLGRDDHINDSVDDELPTMLNESENMGATVESGNPLSEGTDDNLDKNIDMNKIVEDETPDIPDLADTPIGNHGCDQVIECNAPTSMDSENDVLGKLADNQSLLIQSDETNTETTIGNTASEIIFDSSLDGVPENVAAFENIENVVSSEDIETDFTFHTYESMNTPFVDSGLDHSAENVMPSILESDDTPESFMPSINFESPEKVNTSPDKTDLIENEMAVQIGMAEKEIGEANDITLEEQSEVCVQDETIENENGEITCAAVPVETDGPDSEQAVAKPSDGHPATESDDDNDIEEINIPSSLQDTLSISSDSDIECLDEGNASHIKTSSAMDTTNVNQVSSEFLEYHKQAGYKCLKLSQLEKQHPELAKQFASHLGQMLPLQDPYIFVKPDALPGKQLVIQNVPVTNQPTSLPGQPVQALPPQLLTPQIPVQAVPQVLPVGQNVQLSIHQLQQQLQQLTQFGQIVQQKLQLQTGTDKASSKQKNTEPALSDKVELTKLTSQLQKSQVPGQLFVIPISQFKKQQEKLQQLPQANASGSIQTNMAAAVTSNQEQQKEQASTVDDDVMELLTEGSVEEDGKMEILHTTVQDIIKQPDLFGPGDEMQVDEQNLESENTSVKANKGNMIHQNKASTQNQTGPIEPPYVKGKKRTYRCYMCERRYFVKENLFAHIEDIHRDVKIDMVKALRRTVIYYCTKCDMTFRRYCGFYRHKDNHESIRRLCSLCGKTFSNRVSLSNHKRVTHRSDEVMKEKFFCQLCGKIYKDGSTLRAHIAIKHEGKFTHICEICGKKFRSRSSYVGHMNKHEGHIVKKCEKCGQGFYSNGSYHVHKTSCGVTVRAYACNKCDATYLTALKLRMHDNRAHSAVHFTCHTCEKTYQSEISIEKHKRTKMHKRKLQGQQENITKHNKDSYLASIDGVLLVDG